MTSPAGNIGLGVTLDAASLPSQLTNAVTKAVRPAMQQVQSQVASASKSVGNVGTKTGQEYATGFSRGATANTRATLDALFRHSDAVARAQGMTAGRGYSQGVTTGATAGASGTGSRIANAFLHPLRTLFHTGGVQAGKELGAGIGTGASGSSAALHQAGGGMMATVIGGAKAALAGGAAIGIGAAFAKGFTRLADIEDAKTKLTALGYSAQQVEEVAGKTGEVMKVVTGTAYSFGDAMSAAGNAMAAGVKPGEQLIKFMTTMTDTAAMAKAPLNDIAYIFNQVQSAQRVYADDLRQLATRGLPVYQWIADEMTKRGQAMDPAGLRDLMQKGGAISADVFFAAMAEHTKGQAQALGKTVRGSLMNMWTGIGRMTANIMEPFFGSFAANINKLTGVFDQIGEKLRPVMERIAGWIRDNLGPAFAAAMPYIKQAGEYLAQLGRDILDKVMPVLQQLWTNIKGPLIDAGRSLIALFKEIWPTIKVVATVIGGALLMQLKGAANALPVLVRGFTWLVDGLRKVFEVVNTVAPVIKDAFVGAWNALQPVFNGLKTAFAVIAAGAEYAFKTVIIPVWHGLVTVVTWAWNGIGPVFDFLKGVMKAVALPFVAGWELMKPVFGWLKDAFSEAAKFIGQVWSPVVDLIKGVFTGVIGAVKGALAFIGGLLQKVPLKIGPIEIPGAQAARDLGSSLVSIASGNFSLNLPTGGGGGGGGKPDWYGSDWFKTPPPPGGPPTPADLTGETGPGGGDQETQLGVSKDIRDTLQGKGPTSAPLNVSADMLRQLLEQAKKNLPADRLPPGAIPGKIGPFGTPIAPKEPPGYSALAAVISAFGGDPTKLIGPGPVAYAQQQWEAEIDAQLKALQQSRSGGGAPGIAPSQYAGPLADLARTGVLGPELTQFGLDAASPVVKSIIAARNKTKGLKPDEIAALVQQVLSGGGYTGALTPQNSALVSALQAFYNQQAKAAAGAAMAGGIPGVGGMPGGVALGGAGMPSILKDTGKVPSQADAVRAAQIIQQMWPVIQTIGGSRDTGTAPNTHDVGRAIDVMIPPELRAAGGVGDQIRDFFQANAQMLDVVYTIWRDQGLNTGIGGQTPGSTFTVPGHQDHIDIQFGNGRTVSLGSGGLVMPPGVGGTGMPGGAAYPGYGGAFPFGGGTAAGGTVPVFVTNWPGGAGWLQQWGNIANNALLGPVLQGASAGMNQAAGNVIDSAVNAVKTGATPAKTVGYVKLAEEQNPLAVAAMAGFKVPDYSRAGGTSAAGLSTNQGPLYDASGRLASDTGALLDRTLSSTEAANRARHQQVMSVLNQVKDRITEEWLAPIVKAAVQSAINGMSSTTTKAIGDSMGQAAAGPIADAVGSSVSSSTTTSAAGAPGIGTQFAQAVFDEGGLWESGTVGYNLSGSHERVLDPGQTKLFDAGLLGGWNVPPSGAFATTKGVSGTDVVGGEFFGVSQVPILGLLVNVIIRVLLKFLGMDIEVRDTLNELTDEFRGFRGDAFQAFNAQGRLLNDTSALVERSATSAETAAAERVRILKDVITQLIDFIIQKVIVPIVKAVANAAVQALGTAAGTAVSAAITGASEGAAGPAGGLVGSMVSSLITSAGQATVEIVADIVEEFAMALADVLVELIAELLQSMFPGLVLNVFGGGMGELIMGPLADLIGGMFDAALSPMLSLMTFVGGVVTSIGTMLAGLTGGLGGIGLFDEGGLAAGSGLMPKATLAPERVLSPSQTVSFDRLVHALTVGGLVAGSAVHKTINAPITVVGERAAAEKLRDMLELI